MVSTRRFVDLIRLYSLLVTSGNIVETIPTCFYCLTCRKIEVKLKIEVLMSQFWLIVINEIHQISRKKSDFVKLTEAKSEIL